MDRQEMRITAQSPRAPDVLNRHKKRKKQQQPAEAESNLF
jgi:hypothetical protein